MKHNQRILSATIKHIKGARSVVIYRQGSMTKIAGPCGTGKTSIADAIKFAFGGPTLHDSKVITEGEDIGTADFETDDYYVKFKAYHGREGTKGEGQEKTTCKIVGKEGGKFDKGELYSLLPGDQSILFDATEFLGWSNDKQVKIWKQLLGDEWCSKHDEETYALDMLVDARRDARRNLKSMGDVPSLEPEKVERPDRAALLADLAMAQQCANLRAEQSVLALHMDREPEKVELVSISGLTEQLNKANDWNRTAERRRSAITEKDREIQNLEKALAKARSERDALGNMPSFQDTSSINDAISIAEENNAKHAQWVRWNDHRERLENKIADLEPGVTDDACTVEDAQTALEAADKQDRDADRYERWKLRLKAYEEAQSAYSDLDAKVKAQSQIVKDHLASADSPVEGVTFGNVDVIKKTGEPVIGLVKDGIPLKQINEGERILISTAVGIALNPGLRVITVQKGESTDADVLDRMHAMATAENMDLWVFIVDQYLCADCMHVWPKHSDACPKCSSTKVIPPGKGDALVIEAGILEMDKVTQEVT